MSGMTHLTHPFNASQNTWPSKRSEVINYGSDTTQSGKQLHIETNKARARCWNTPRSQSAWPFVLRCSFRKVIPAATGTTIGYNAFDDSSQARHFTFCSPLKQILETHEIATTIQSPLRWRTMFAGRESSAHFQHQYHRFIRKGRPNEGSTLLAWFRGGLVNGWCMKWHAT